VVDPSVPVTRNVVDTTASPRSLAVLQVTVAVSPAEPESVTVVAAGGFIVAPGLLAPSM